MVYASKRVAELGRLLGNLVAKKGFLFGNTNLTPGAGHLINQN